MKVNFPENRENYGRRLPSGSRVKPWWVTRGQSSRKNMTF